MTVPETNNIDGPVEDGLIWYFGFGSMCNAVSLKRRDISPVESRPAALCGYQLRFHLHHGMANIVPCDKSIVHGVLHKITPDEFDRLAKVEAIYDWTALECLPYKPMTIAQDSQESTDAATSASLVPSHQAQFLSQVKHLELEQPIVARGFIIPLDKVPEIPEDKHLPSERYLTIILLGQKHFGVCPAWVAHLESTQQYTPSRKPHEYVQASAACDDPSSLPVMSKAALEQHKGSKEGPIITAVGRKVLKIEVSSSTPDSMRDILGIYYRGKELSFWLVMVLYEPSLPEVAVPEDMTEQHVAWAEDFAVHSVQDAGCSVEHIAWLEQ